MATVSQTIKGTLSNAKLQLEGLEKKAVKQVSLFEKKAAKQVALLEKKAKASLDEVKGRVDEVPKQLYGAWAEVVHRFRGALDFASNEDLKKLVDKVDELSKKVDKLVRGEKIKSAANSKSKST
jgi:hypothetical protein